MPSTTASRANHLTETPLGIKPIKTDTDYRVTRKEIESLMTAAADTPAGERLDVLVTRVEAWERTHCAMDLPDPVEAITFEMERKGLTVKDLEPLIGRGLWPTRLQR